ncbi:hypothetical protein ACT8ZS_33360 [Paenibacillus sp. M.A.Huq-84]
MAAYVQSGVVMTLLLGIGLLFIGRTKSRQPRSLNSRLARWTGYALIAMTIFLIVVGVLQYLAESSHSYGH